MKNSKKHIIKKVTKWLNDMLSQYKDNNGYLNIRVDLHGHDLTTDDTIISCEFNEGLRLQDDVEYITLSELNKKVKQPNLEFD